MNEISMRYSLYCYVKLLQNAHPWHRNKPGTSICWKYWARTCDTSKPCLFTFSKTIFHLHTWWNDQVRYQIIPNRRSTLYIIQNICIVKVKKNTLYISNTSQHIQTSGFFPTPINHRCQIRCTRSNTFYDERVGIYLLRWKNVGRAERRLEWVA